MTEVGDYPSGQLLWIHEGDGDSRAGQSLIRRKVRQHERMPLPVDGGDTIATYLQGRRAGADRHLFVTAEAASPAIRLVRGRRKACPQDLCGNGPEASFGRVRRPSAAPLRAVGMLVNDASLGEVGDLLRRRDSTKTIAHAAGTILPSLPLPTRLSFPLKGHSRLRSAATSGKEMWIK